MSERPCMVCGAPVECEPGYPPIRVACAGCIAERGRLLAILRDEAIAGCRALGCTCQPEPRMRLTVTGFGRYGLPAWISEHDDGCQVVPEVAR